jgi:hypothetical protein
VDDEPTGDATTARPDGEPTDDEQTDDRTIDTETKTDDTHDTHE